jgi:hypothetical protein
MIARFDHRPMLTAALALSTTVLVVVVITLATLLITAAPPAATSSSESGGNPGAAAVPSENYGHGVVLPKRHDMVLPKPAQTGDSVEPHQELPSAHYGL